MIRKVNKITTYPFFKMNNYLFSSSYIAPQSQIQIFKQHIFNIHNKDSLVIAADLMAQLETDKETYSYNLIKLNQTYDIIQKANPRIVDIANKRKIIQNQINNQIKENNLIQSRFNKQLENVKFYGIFKIAKEIIEVSDHIKIALSMIQKSRSQIKREEKMKLQELDQNLQNILKKYHIEEFNPINEYFDPNVHESFGQILTQDQTKKNIVAQVKRTGFKIKDRLLRSAYVLIYI